MAVFRRVWGRRRGTSVSPKGDVPPRIAPSASLLERVRDALFSLDHDWRFVYLNAAAERLVGASRDELLGRSLWERFPEMVGSLFEQQYRAALAGGSPVSFEACHPPLGTWVEVSAYPSEGGLEIQARDITPGMRAAESLRRWARIDEVRFRTLVEHAADIVGLLNADGTVRYVSQAIERVLGYAPATIIGRSAFTLVHPDDLPRLFRFLDRDGMPQDAPMPVECRLLHADGTWRFIELIGNDQLDDPDIAGVVISARDITWRMQLERELHTREASYKAIFDGAVIGIGVSDLNGRLRSANQAIQSFLGYTEAELAGHALTEYLHPADVWEGSTGLFDDLVQGHLEHYSEIKRFLRKDGDTVWGSLTVSLIRSSVGQPMFVIAMVEDITERQRAEAELAVARRRLAASREAERLSLARELHDGPVQDLLAVTFELARLGQGNDTDYWVADTRAAMERERTRLLGVVGQLRGVVSELRPPGLVEFGLPTALRGYVASLEEERAGSVPTIRLDLDERAADLPHSLAHTVFRIVQEAVRNAVRHAGASTITIQVKSDPTMVRVQVRDDGCGFRVPERLNDFARNGHFGLVGLVERVEQADGRVTVTSAPGRGTTISVLVPGEGMGGGNGRTDTRAAG